jgi:hypothetical protein
MRLNMQSELRNNFKVVFTSTATGFFRLFRLCVWSCSLKMAVDRLNVKWRGPIIIIIIIIILYIYRMCKFLDLN